MTPSLYTRLIWLLGTIYSSGPISKQEIDRRWLESPLNVDHEDGYEARSFHRHKEAILELLDVDIQCDRKHGHVYYIDSSKDLSSLIQSFMPLLLQGDKNLAARVLAEPAPASSRHLPAIVEAMRQGVVLQVTYQSALNPQPSALIFLLMPYCLKQFRGRWYVVGRSSKQDDLKVYALDVIARVEWTPKRFKFPRSWKAEKHFEGFFGVDRSLEPETITVRVTGKTVQRLLRHPIHSSQRLMEKTEDQAVFTYWLAPTKEFAEALRAYGSAVEVLSPGEFRQHFIDDTQWQARNYGMNLHYIGEQLSLF